MQVPGGGGQRVLNYEQQGEIVFMLRNMTWCTQNQSSTLRGRPIEEENGSWKDVNPEKA